MRLQTTEKNKLVKRVFFAEIPPKVEYSLTERSKKLCYVFKSIEEWMDEN